MNTVPPDDARKLTSSLCMLASPIDGEILAAVHAIKRLLTKNGLGFDDLAPSVATVASDAAAHHDEPDDPKAWRRAMYPERSGPPERAEITKEHQRLALRLFHSATGWNAKEREFLLSMAERRSSLTSGQAEWLHDLERKARRQRTEREMAA